MNDKTKKLNDLLSNVDAGYSLSQEDSDWLNLKLASREIVFNDFSINQLEKLASLRLKEVIKKTDIVSQKLNQTIKDINK